MSCDKVLNAMKLGHEILFQYYHEQVISVVDRSKKLSDAKLIIKLASNSIGKRIFRDLKLKFTFSLKRKHLLMGKMED